MNREPQNSARVPMAYKKKGAGRGRLAIMAMRGGHALIAHRSASTDRVGMIRRAPIYRADGVAAGIVYRGKKIPFREFSGTGWSWKSL